MAQRRRVVQRAPAGAPGAGRPPVPGWQYGGLAAAATAAVLVSLSGCAKMDAALDKQWMVVDFGPHTTVAAAMHVRAACSRIPNTPPLPLPASHSVINVMYGVRFDTTNSSPANLAALQVCLQKFTSVLGVNAENTGDEGS